MVARGRLLDAELDGLESAVDALEYFLKNLKKYLYDMIQKQKFKNHIV